MRQRRIAVGNPDPWDHPSYYPVGALVTELVARGNRALRIPGLMTRVTSRMPIRIPRWGRGNFIVVPMMGPRFNLLSACALFGRPVVYAWDVWEKDIDLWARNIKRYDVALVICTSKDSKRLLELSGLKCPIIYLPEATEVEVYWSDLALTDRSVTVLELGRRSPVWHESVADCVALEGKVHLYEKTVGELVFEQYTDMVAGFKNSVISVCLPRSITHHESSGQVSTFTHRYLESMAAGCLVLGHAPADLCDLFGYNPVVEIDWNDPASQLRSILENLAEFQPFVNNNRAVTRRLGSWGVRASEVELAIKHTLIQDYQNG